MYNYNYFYGLQMFYITSKERRDGLYWEMVQILSR